MKDRGILDTDGLMDLLLLLVHLISLWEFQLFKC